MPIPAIDTTIGATANSYVTEQQAADYHDARLNTEAWSGATADDKRRALLMAAKRLNGENWLGSRATTTQALAWPRLYVAKVDGSGGGFGWGYGYGWMFGEVYLQTEIPQQVKDAQCEFALLFLSSGGTSVAAGTIESFTVDGLNVKFAAGGSTATVDESAALNLIAGLVSGNLLQRG